GLFAASYSIIAFFTCLGSLFFDGFDSKRWIVLLPSIFMIVLILRPLEDFLRVLTDKFLFRKKYDYKDLLKTFSEEVLSVLELDKLLNLTVKKLSAIIHLGNAGILLYDDESDTFQLSAYNGGNCEIGPVSGGDPLIRYFRQNREFLLWDEFDEPQKGFRGMDDTLNVLRAGLVIPLVSDKKLLGFLTLGKKNNEEDFTPDDIDILLPLSRTLSIAVTNAQLVENLSKAQSQAAQTEKMAVIGTLSAGINHEICNPLGIVRGQCEMFLLNYREGHYKDLSPEGMLEKAQEIMEKVVNEIDRATAITRKLSSFAKPASGEIMDGVNAGKELDNVIALVEHDLRLDKIEIKKEFDGTLPGISADPKQLQEIFFNIIRNAAQAIHGKGEIKITSRAAEGKVYIDISDTGVGISKANITQVFNPFFTTKIPSEGTGLGLFIVKQIVERNNGQIFVTSEEGKGTTFHLVFNTFRV
ncbi:MAG: ATP-binding protein, partial [Candidatus Omnitrophota bacterium]